MDKPTEYTLTRTVTKEMTASAIGKAGENIFSTPDMIRLAELTTLSLAKYYHPAGMTSVGAEIRCRHLAPTPVGMQVRAVARLKSIEGRKMRFDFEIFDENGKCGEGEHLRITVPDRSRG